jgi:hypothetical protein
LASGTDDGHGVAAMSIVVHLLQSYGKAATKTLCGIRVPALRGASRGNILWAHPGRETCAACQAAAKARAATLGVTPPKRIPGAPRLGPTLLQRKPPKPGHQSKVATAPPVKVG